MSSCVRNFCIFRVIFDNACLWVRWAQWLNVGFIPAFSRISRFSNPGRKNGRLFSSAPSRSLDGGVRRNRNVVKSAPPYPPLLAIRKCWGSRGYQFFKQIFGLNLSGLNPETTCRSRSRTLVLPAPPICARKPRIYVFSYTQPPCGLPFVAPYGPRHLALPHNTLHVTYTKT